MKKGKKLLAIIVGILMMATLAVTVAACGDDAGDDANDASTLRADVFWYSYTDNFLTTIRDGNFTAQMAEFNRVVNHNSQGSQSRQLDQISEAIAAGSDLLMVNMVDQDDETAGESIVTLAKEAGLPLIFFNREVPDSIVKSYAKCTFIGTKPEEAGIMEGMLISQFLLKAENINTDGSSKFAGSDGNIRYATLRGGLDNKEAQYRTLYSVRTAQAELAEAGKTWKLVNAGAAGGNGWTSPGDTWLNNAKDADGVALTADDKAIMGSYIYGTNDWSDTVAKAQFAIAFPNKADVENKDKLGIIIGNNDGMALGVIKYLQDDFNLNTSKANAIPVFGVDALADALDAMEAGAMVGTILQSNVNYAKLLAKFAYTVVGDTNMAGKITVNYTQDSGVNKVRMPYEIVS